MALSSSLDTEIVSSFHTCGYYSIVLTYEGTSKHYSGYGLTSLGFEQNFQVGSKYRERYLSSTSPQRIFNISEDKYIPSQIYATAPDQAILVNTATAFLQGFYPPLGSSNPEIASSTLNNGTVTQNPLDGYQYVFLRGADTNSPDTIWLKGDDDCPAYSRAASILSQSTEYQSRLTSTADFYAGFADLLSDVYNYTPQNLTYENAYDIFDLLNVAHIHNASLPRNLTMNELSQLRTLADSAELAANFNATQPARSIGARTLAGLVLAQLNQTVASAGRKPKFSLLAGSYDTFLAFFGLAGLTDVNVGFTGLPAYASSMAFEVFSDGDGEAFPRDTAALSVRFMFHNGTAGALDNFPLFGREDSVMPWGVFVEEIEKRAIRDLEEWCGVCESREGLSEMYAMGQGSEGTEGRKGGMSNAVAGVIGAMVTVGVVAVCGVVAGAVLWWKRRQGARTIGEKGSVSSGSASA